MYIYIFIDETTYLGPFRVCLIGWDDYPLEKKAIAAMAHLLIIHDCLVTVVILHSYDDQRVFG